jgi:hypothetical protein
MPDQSPPPTVYLLAEHLDAALAAGEDLLKARFDLRLPVDAEPGRVVERLAARHRFVDALKSLELTLMQRVLRAREYAGYLAEDDERFQSLAQLFVGGTAALEDAVSELSARERLDDRLSQDTVAYLRGRGVLPPDAAGLERLDEIRPTEAFLLAERISLGPLLDMLATFLDALEIHFDLFADDDTTEASERTLADIIATLR